MEKCRGTRQIFVFVHRPVSLRSSKSKLTILCSHNSELLSLRFGSRAVNKYYRYDSYTNWPSISNIRLYKLVLLNSRFNYKIKLQPQQPHFLNILHRHILRPNSTFYLLENLLENRGCIVEKKSLFTPKN